jgi:hypothetical protein
MVTLEEIQAVITAAELIPPTLRTEVHFTFAAQFVIDLLTGVITYKNEAEIQTAKATALEVELAEIQAAPIKVEPIEETPAG